MRAQTDLEPLKEYARANKPTVVLDTNIVIRGEKSKVLTEACALLDVRICDTVYWEFLRNLNIDRFRERRTFLASWQASDFLQEKMIIREDNAVTAMHLRLFILLLSLHSHSPESILGFVSPDLWIAAAAVTHRYDHVLTENRADFPSSLFDTIVTLATDPKVYLLRFKRKEAQDAWIRLIDDPAIKLNVKGSLS